MSLLSSIIRDTPTSVTELNAALPSEFGRIIRRCLMKDPSRRYQTAADLRNELEDLKQDLDSGALLPPRAPTPPARSSTSTRAGVLAVAAVLVGIASAAAYVWVRGRQSENTTQPMGARTFTQLTRQQGREQFPSLSPDGKWIVYDGNQTGNSDIYLQSVGGQNAINLTPDSPDDDTQPAFSPDGESIAFRSERQGGGIFVMGRTGESIRRITDNGYTPAWSPDGTRLVYGTAVPGVFGQSNSSLRVVALASGEQHQISAQDESAVQPSWSPHGKRIAYWTVAGRGTVFRASEISTRSRPRAARRRQSPQIAPWIGIQCGPRMGAICIFAAIAAVA